MTTLIGAESVALMANITPEFASSIRAPLNRGTRAQRSLPRC